MLGEKKKNKSKINELSSKATKCQIVVSHLRTRSAGGHFGNAQGNFFSPTHSGSVTTCSVHGQGELQAPNFLMFIRPCLLPIQLSLCCHCFLHSLSILFLALIYRYCAVIG